MSKPINTFVIKREAYRVAVFYPNGWEKYGGVREYLSKEPALKDREKLLEMGHKHVHVWRVVETMVAT